MGEKAETFCVPVEGGGSNEGMSWRLGRRGASGWQRGIDRQRVVEQGGSKRLKELRSTKEGT